MVRALDEADVPVEDIALRRPTLDEVFLALTGHSTTRRDNDDGGDGSNDNKNDKDDDGTGPTEDAA